MEPSKEEKIIMINNNDILPNRFQPRKKFSEEELLDLTESIKKYGVLEPIIVRPLGDKYELVAGERRYKANVLAGNDTIPARIINLDDAESSEIAIIENLQRKDLSALEEALSYKRAIDLGYATQQQLAEKVGKSQSYIANKIRLLKLSDEVQDALLDNKISERHARSLLRLDGLQKQNEMLNRIINERLTVRRTDEEIDKMNNTNNSINGEQLQTTPLSTIFNNQDNNQSINENGVFTFGPETAADNNQGQALMSFDLNGNPVSTESNSDGTSGAPQFNMFGSTPEVAPEPQMASEPQVSAQPEPFNMFGSTPEVAPEPQMAAEPQVSAQPEPFNMFGSTPEVAPAPQMAVEPQVSAQPEPFNMFGSTPEVAPAPQIAAEPQVSAQPEPFNMFGSTPEVAPAPQMAVEPQVSAQPEPFNMFGSTPEVAPAPQMAAEPQVSAQPEPFNMFGSTPEVAPAPQMAAEPQVSAQPEPFNMFGSTPEVAPAPQMAAEPQVSAQPEPFNMFGSTPEVAPAPQMAVEPQVSAQPEPFGMNNINNQQPVQSFNLDNGTNDIPSSMPQTPIFSSNQPNDNIAEFKKPDPIIVTDYSKQYDPVMPQTQPKAPDIDLKTIINLIRQCSETIEKCGYKIDTEEYDLENMYQVVFKIDKH